MVKNNDMKRLIFVVAIIGAWMQPMAQVITHDTMLNYYAVPKWLIKDTIPVIMLVADTSAIAHTLPMPIGYTRNSFQMPSNICFWVRGYIVRERWRGFTMLLDEQKKPISQGWIVWMWQAI